MKTQDYNSFSSPLDVPVHVAEIACEAERKVVLPARYGHTPITLLHGLFQRVLLATQCRHSQFYGHDDLAAVDKCIKLSEKQNGPKICPCMNESLQCREPDVCPGGNLIRVPLSWQPGRTLPPLVKISAPELWQGRELALFTLRVTIIGRRALRFAPEIWQTLHLMGRIGMAVGGAGRIRFRPGRPQEVFHGTLRQQNKNNHGSECIWQFVSPILLAENVKQDDGSLVRVFQDGGALNPARILGNLAYDLCSLDLDDREDSVAVEERQQLIEKCRIDIRERAQSLRIVNTQLTAVDWGWRRSKTSNGAMDMHGFIGHARLQGVSEELIPWLMAMSYWRIGQLSSKGFGDVAIRW